MKKLLIALLLFAGFVAAAPKAEAGQFARIYNGRGVVYVHKSQLYGYGGGYYAPYKIRKHKHYRGYASYPYYRDRGCRSYSRPYAYYGRPAYYGYSRPRVSVSFGF